MGAIFSFTRISFLLLVSVLISACSNPYALKISSINLEGKQGPAAIQFSDIQLYKREALVNERRDERAYLKGLLEESKTIKFEPDIIRQLDVIRTISGSLGLGFNPATALEFKQAAETGAIQQQIAVTQLNMQLDQLKRDAELLRQKLASQTEPSQGATSGQITKPAQLPAGPAVPDVSADLIKAIDNFTTQLKTSPAALTKAGVSGNPSEVFMDRQAYRDELKMALNTASLDELHDLDGNSLFRLQFNATVLPEKNEKGNLNRLGVLRMQIERPDITEREYSELYQEWLNYVNNQLNIAPDPALDTKDQAFQANPNLLQLGRVGIYYKIITLSIPKSQSSSDKKIKNKKNQVNKQNPQDSPEKEVKDQENPGEKQEPQDSPIKIVEIGEDLDIKNNWYLRIAIPPDLYDNAKDLLDDVIASMSKKGEKGEKSKFVKAIECFSKKLKVMKKEDCLAEINNCKPCDDKWKASREKYDPLKNWKLEDALDWSNNLVSYPTTLAIRSEIGLLDSANQQKLLGVTGDLTEKIIWSPMELLKQFKECLPACEAKWKEKRGKENIKKSESFREALEKSVEKQRGNRTAVYLVSPTGRFQRLSTAARATDALALAGAISADLPAQGLGAKGTASFSRSAQGKVDAMERSPLVVGFSEPATVDGMDNQSNPPAFGWILGPKVVLNPEKQRLEFEQYIAPYNLSADLSLPGWWPYFTIKAQTAWAPNWRDPQFSGQTLKLCEPNTERRIRVPLKHNTNDMEGLTSLLIRDVAGARMEIPSITRVIPSTISLCQPTGQKVSFLIKGNNIWQATQANLNGLMAEESDIEVLPDMKGLRVNYNLSNLPQPSGGSFKKGHSVLTVGTPNGTASKSIYITGKKDSSGKCEDLPSTSKPEPPQGSPSIISVDPSKISARDRSPIFVVQGKNLGPSPMVFLGDIEGKPEQLPSKDGCSSIIKVTVKEIDPNKIKYLTSLPLIIVTEKGVTKQDIELVLPKEEKSKEIGLDGI